MSMCRVFSCVVGRGCLLLIPSSALFISISSVSYGITTLFHWVLVCTRFCLSPQRVESRFSPVLWKSCNQIPLVFKVRFPGDSWSLCWISRLGSLMWGSEPSHSERNSSVWLISSLWVAYLEGMGFHFIVICAPPTSSLQRLLCLWMWTIFFFFVIVVGFQCPPVNGCLKTSCNFGFMLSLMRYLFR